MLPRSIEPSAFIDTEHCWFIGAWFGELKSTQARYGEFAKYSIFGRAERRKVSARRPSNSADVCYFHREVKKTASGSYGDLGFFVLDQIWKM